MSDVMSHRDSDTGRRAESTRRRGAVRNFVAQDASNAFFKVSHEGMAGCWNRQRSDPPSSVQSAPAEVKRHLAERGATQGFSEARIVRRTAANQGALRLACGGYPSLFSTAVLQTAFGAKSIISLHGPLMSAESAPQPRTAGFRAASMARRPAGVRGAGTRSMLRRDNPEHQGGAPRLEVKLGLSSGRGIAVWLGEIPYRFVVSDSAVTRLAPRALTEVFRRR